MNKSALQLSDVSFGWTTVFAQHCSLVKSRHHSFSFAHPDLLAAMTAVCLLMNFLDVITTSFGLCYTDDMAEGNAFANTVILKYGILGGITLLSIIKMGAPIGFFALLRLCGSRFRMALFTGLAANIAIVLAAVANNVILLYNNRL